MERVEYHRRQSSPPVRVEYFQAGRVVKIVCDQDADGHPERMAFFQGGVIQREEFDEDHDGFLEETVYYEHGQPTRVEKDLNADGKPEEILYLEKGRLKEQVRLFKDKKEVRFFDPQKGTLQRMELYQRGRERPEAVYFYHEEQLVEVKRDAHGDGFFEEVFGYKGRHLLWAREDRDHDHFYERTIYYGPNGQPEKILLDRNRDGKAEVTSFLKNGRVVKVVFDENGDGKPDKILYPERAQEGPSQKRSSLEVAP